MEERKEVIKKITEENKEILEKVSEEYENIKKSEKNLGKILTIDTTENEPVIPKKKIKKFKKVKKIKKQITTQSESDGCLIAILGMIFPYIGIILYFLWRKSKPESAICVLKGSGISIIFVGIILSIILGINFLANYMGL